MKLLFNRIHYALVLIIQLLSPQRVPNGQIHLPGEPLDGGVGCYPLNVGAERVDRIDEPPETDADEVMQQPETDRDLPVTGSDNRDPLRFEDFVETFDARSLPPPILESRDSAVI